MSSRAPRPTASGYSERETVISPLLTPEASTIVHGEFFTVSDGVTEVTYQFLDPAAGEPSRGYVGVPIYFDGSFTAGGETGAQRLPRFKQRVMRWLELRYRSGFSEWLSNVYYNEDIPALLVLVELCQDQEHDRPHAVDDADVPFEEADKPPRHAENDQDYERK